MHKTLYRKYRPHTFREVAGENEIVSTLKSAIKNNKLSHAYLFTGPRGIGKTTIARLIAKGVNCLNLESDGEPCDKCENCLSINEGNFLDLIEIDAASNRGIDEIRQLKEKINYQPSVGRKKVYLIDEVHMLTKEAFNALLKTLEEPPSYVIFILATTEPEKILPTIISRCQRYDFKILSFNEMKDKINDIASSENIDMEEEIFELIYESSGGSMRDAISILERLIITNLNGTITFERSEKILGVTPTKKMETFLEGILNSDHNSLLAELDKMWEESFEIENFFKDFAKFSKNLIIKNKLEPKIALNIISKVYDSLNKFKFEEDKRLVGYVIVNELIKSEEKTVIKEEIRYITKESTPDIVSTPNKVSVPVNVSIDTVISKWEEVVASAKKEKISMGAFLNGSSPSKIVDNYLYISYDYENNFCKEQIEKDPYDGILLSAVHKVIDPGLKIKYILSGEKKNTKKTNENFAKKVVDFFGGEITN